ncbi:hypothetical protein G6F37_005888 [Rhizopus arrhizus]|nr:hypothetical protein G6F38_005168 [Rhizopus arrhizus]KAG1158341.1 hypothetical protein G6F37_005888 [Rhizopus arrhizus]
MPPDNTAVVTTTFEKSFLKDRSITFDHSGFKLSLYKNSKVYRIVLNNPVKSSKICLNRWNRIDLKLVTEMGLPVMATEQPIVTSCKLLQRETIGYTESKDLLIDCRPVAADSWEGMNDKASNDQTGCFEYRIILNNKTCSNNTFFIYIHADELSLHALPLCLGPFQLIQDLTPEKRLFWDDTTHDVNMHRVLPLDDQHHLVLKEMWDNGTPGKLWDSALMMSQIIIRLFKCNKEFLSGLRIMDLSAGVGSLGLLISELSHVYRIPNPPTVVLTDIPEALPLIKHNLSLNDNHNHVQIKTLRWGLTRDIDRVLKRRPFDYIFVSDVLYNANDFYSLIVTFRLLCDAAHPTKLYMGYKPRGLKAYEEDIFFTNCAVYFDIKQLGLKEFERDLLGNEQQADESIDRSLRFTGVQLYRLLPRKEKLIHKEK